MQKNEAVAPIRQTVGLLAYFFPSFAPSRFNIEVPLTLEETAERLTKLSRVQVSKPVPTRFDPSYSRFDQFVNHRDTVVERPITVNYAILDADTLRCRVVLSDNRFRVVVRGYLKRWDQFSTVVNVRASFNPHYLSLLVKSAAYTVMAVAVCIGLLITAVALGMFSALQPLFILLLGPAAAHAPMLGSAVQLFPLIVRGALLFFPLVVLGLWITEVVIPAHTRRARLLTRIEDILLLPML